MLADDIADLARDLRILTLTLSSNQRNVLVIGIALVVMSLLAKLLLT